MTISLRLVEARVNDTASNLTFKGENDAGERFELSFDEQNGEQLLMALVSVLGQTARLRMGDTTLKKVLPLEWWEINPHPARDGLLQTFRIAGGMEITFHLGAGAVPRYEEVLTTLTGTRKQTPGGQIN